MRHRRAALRADFRQYYALCLDGMGRSFSVSEAADLAAMLPPASRTYVLENPANAWTMEHLLLARCANELAVLRWFGSEDGRKGRNRPTPIMPPGEGGDTESYDLETLERILNMERKDVEHAD